MITYLGITYRRILPGVVVMGILAQCSAPVQLDEELVVVASRAIDVHAVGVVRVA